MPYLTTFPFIPPSNFLADIQHLNVDEVGAYILFIVEMWQSDDATLPDDDVVLAKIARTPRDAWRLGTRPRLGHLIQSVENQRVTNPQVYREFHRWRAQSCPL